MILRIFNQIGNVEDGKIKRAADIIVSAMKRRESNELH